MLEDYVFDGSKALVVFTDGGDNDSDDPSALKDQIKASDLLRISIGLEGNDFDKDDLIACADSKSNSQLVKNKDKLQKMFEVVARQVRSVYTIVYDRSDQILADPIQVKFQFTVEKIK